MKSLWPSGLTQILASQQLSLRHRLSIERCDLKWAQNLVVENHYLHRPVDRRALPFAYAIALDKKPVGTIIMAIPHWNKQAGLFTTQEKWLAGDRHLLTNWQVLVISRLWLSPDVQQRQTNGHASCVASCAIAPIAPTNSTGLDRIPPPGVSRVALPLPVSFVPCGHRGRA